MENCTRHYQSRRLTYRLKSFLSNLLTLSIWNTFSPQCEILIRLLHSQTGIALIELYIGRHAPLKARLANIYKQCWTKRAAYIEHDTQQRGRCGSLYFSITNIKHLLACLQIANNTIIDDTFIYRDIVMLVYACKRAEMTNKGGSPFNSANPPI